MEDEEPWAVHAGQTKAIPTDKTVTSWAHFCLHLGVDFSFYLFF